MVDLNKIATFEIGTELLAQLLHLPKGTYIVDLKQKKSPFGVGNLEITVYHPDLKERKPNELPPKITPVFESKRSLVELVDWGYDE